jgi:hypothetical protein
MTSYRLRNPNFHRRTRPGLLVRRPIVSTDMQTLLLETSGRNEAHHLQPKAVIHEPHRHVWQATIISSLPCERNSDLRKMLAAMTMEPTPIHDMAARLLLLPARTDLLRSNIRSLAIIHARLHCSTRLHNHLHHSGQVWVVESLRDHARTNNRRSFLNEARFL